MKITVDMALACEVTASFDGIGIDVAVELSKPCCALENVSIANVTNDTAPEATDKLFLWRAVKGWFYIQFGNFLHNLFGGRDVADCHPAKAITFDVDPVPDFTAVAKGNTLEAITHKVAWLQDLDKMLQNLIQKDQWFDLYLNAANTAVSGSGVVTLQPKGAFVRTLGTSGSAAMIYLSRNSGYSNGLDYYKIDWSKNIIIIIYLMRQDVGTSDSESWAFLGSLEGDPIADPAQKGIGLKIVNKAVSGICHNGTTINSISLGDAVNMKLFGVTIHSKGDGNVDYYFNNSFVGTCTGGPTGLSVTNAASLRFLIQSISGDSIMGVFTIKMYVEQ